MTPAEMGRVSNLQILCQPLTLKNNAWRERLASVRSFVVPHRGASASKGPQQGLPRPWRWSVHAVEEGKAIAVEQANASNALAPRKPVLTRPVPRSSSRQRARGAKLAQARLLGAVQRGPAENRVRRPQRISGWSWLVRGAASHGEERLRRNERVSDRSAGYTRNGWTRSLYTVIESP